MHTTHESDRQSTRGFTVEETIARPAGEVWQGLTDPRIMASWMGVDAIEFEDGAPTPGSTVRFHARGKARSARVEALEAPRRFALESTQGGVTARYTYEVEAVDPGRSRVRLEARCSTRGLWWRMLSPLISFAMRKTDGGQLAALRRAIEARPPAEPAR